MSIRHFSICLTVILSILLTSPYAFAGLIIDTQYSLVSSARVSRTEIEYTYSAKLTNTDDNANNVTATVTSASENTVIIDGELSFGDVPNGYTVTSQDTFTIRQNRRFAFDPADLTWSASDDRPLELLSHEFVELRGRKGHQGLFPLFSTPTSGSAIVHTTTNKNLKELTITVVTDFGDTRFNTLNEKADNDKKNFYTDVVLPSTPFKLQFKMTSERDEIVIVESDVILPSPFTLFLSSETHNFSPGKNNAILSISNHSNVDQSYDVLVNATGSVINKTLTSKTINVLAGETQNLLIPIIIPESIDSHLLTVIAQVNETGSSSFEEAVLKVLILDEPLTLSESDSELIINPGACMPLDPSQKTVNILIPGSDRLNVNNIDLDTIEAIIDESDLLDVNLVDIAASLDKPCDQQQADGKMDLLMTFDLQDFIANNLETFEIYNEFDITILYFTKTRMRHSYNGTLTFQ